MVIIYFHVSVNSMSLSEVKQLNAELRQQIQGKDSVSVLFTCATFDTENPLLASSAFKFRNGIRTY